MEEEDPFDFLLKLSEISSSQEHLLRFCPFCGESVNAGDNPPATSSRFPPEESAGILLFSLPETQDAAGKFDSGGTQDQDDVFHTPPEKSSLPSSGDQPLDHCTRNQELGHHDDALGSVNLGDSHGTGCVNLSRDSDLGFTEVQPAQGFEIELAAQSPRGIKQDAVDEGFGGFERGSCSRDGIGELPVKKLKLSEPKPVFESREVDEGNGNCDEKVGSGAESPCNVGVDAFEPLKVVVPVEQVSRDNEIPLQETAANELKWGEEGQKMENSVNELVSVEEGQKKKISVFDVLKFLAENSDNNEDDDDGNDDDTENTSLLDVVRIHGIDFPRPRWWPDTDLFRKKRG